MNIKETTLYKQVKDIQDLAYKQLVKLIKLDEEQKKRDKLDTIPLTYKIFKFFNKNYTPTEDNDFRIPMHQTLSKLIYEKKAPSKHNILIAKILLNYSKANLHFKYALMEMSNSKEFSIYLRLLFRQMYKSADEEGERIDKIFDSYCTNILDPDLLITLSLGQDISKLEDCLQMYIDDVDFKNSVRKKIFWALAYPVFTCLAILVTCVLMKIYIVPQMTLLIPENQLPSGVLFSLRVAETIMSPLKLIFTTAIIIGVHTIFKKNRILKTLKDLLFINIPYINDYIITSDLCFFFRALYYQMSVRKPASEAHECALKVIKSNVIKEVLESFTESIKLGDSAVKAYADLSFLKETSKLYLNSAIESGNADDAIKNISLEYKMNLENVIAVLIGVIPNVSIVVISGLICYMLVPLLNVINNVGDFL